MAKSIDLTGKTFGMLTVVSKLPSRVGVRKSVAWRCRCECGNWSPCVVGNNLRSGNTISCGCQSSRLKATNSTHGESNTYWIWMWDNMKKRCYNESNQDYKNYGGRGIEVHAGWANDSCAFISWMKENLGDRPDGHSLDRIDPNKNYEPGNLRWADARTQSQNRRCYNGRN